MSTRRMRSTRWRHRERSTAFRCGSHRGAVSRGTWIFGSATATPSWSSLRPGGSVPPVTGGVGISDEARRRRAERVGGDAGSNGRTPAEMGRCDRTYHVPRSTSVDGRSSTRTWSRSRGAKNTASVGFGAQRAVAAGSTARHQRSVGAARGNTGGSARFTERGSGGFRGNTGRAWREQRGSRVTAAVGDGSKGRANAAGRTRTFRGAAHLQGFGPAAASSTAEDRSRRGSERTA